MKSKSFYNTYAARRNVFFGRVVFFLTVHCLEKAAVNIFIIKIIIIISGCMTNVKKEKMIC